MTLELKQSVSATISFGPFLDATNAVDLEVGLATAMDNVTTGIRISKNGGNIIARNATVTGTTYDEMGMYVVTLDATDTGTLGALFVIFEEAATCLPVWKEIQILAANVWDTKYGADTFDVNVDTIKTQTVTCAAGVTVNPSVGAATIQPTVTQFDARTLVAASYTVVSDLGTVQTGDSFALIGTAGAGLTNLGASSNDWNTTVPDVAGTAPTAAEIETEIWDALQSAHVIADSMGAIATELAAVKAETVLIVADTGELQTNQGNWITAVGFNTVVPPTEAQMNARTLVSAGYASPTNITAGVITTVTNLTNAPTAGDLTAAMKTSVNTEADTALTDIGLDHLISAALPTSWAVDVVSGSVFDQIADDGTAVYDRTTDSLQAVKDSFNFTGASVDAHITGGDTDVIDSVMVDMTSTNLSKLDAAISSLNDVSVANLDTACDTVTVTSIGTDVITAASLNADAVTEIRDSILPVSGAALNNLEFLFVAASDHVTPVTGAGTMTVTRSIDGGAFGAGTGTGPAEVGNGIYQYDASTADMTGGIITFRFAATSGTPGAPDDAFLTVVTGAGV